MKKPELDTRVLRDPPSMNRRYKIKHWYGDLSPSEASELTARVETIEAAGLVAEVSLVNGNFTLYAARRITNGGSDA